MNKAVRKAIIAGNWKMNQTQVQTKALIEEMKPLVKDADCGVVLCVPYTDLAAAIETAKGSNIKIGAENCHWANSGAFTGEISAQMLTEMGGEYVIICVGETLEQREQGITSELVAMQTKIALGGVSAQEMEKVIIAYEPVWAIGTGKTATAEQANEVNHTIRETIKALYGESVAEKAVVQYGGSMNAGNAEELLAQPDVDGGLIGGASLKAKDFSVIVAAASK